MIPGATILVTGATGFVGRVLVRRLLADGWQVRAACRGTPPEEKVDGLAWVAIGDIGPETDWSAALADCAYVVHLAAAVHGAAGNAETVHQRINAAGTRRLGEACVAAGVRRLVFLSSVKVNGEGRAEPYRSDDPPAPADAYGRSKRDGERFLREIAQASSLETVVLRTPLVYGPGVKANFLALMKAVAAGWPLPLAGIDNRRSLIYVENLVDAIVCCLEVPGAAGNTYLVSDGVPLSTSELLQEVGRALARPARLLAVPSGLLRGMARLAGRSGAADRLLGSLTVDDRPLRTELGWRPPFTVAQGLAATARWFKEAGKC